MHFRVMATIFDLPYTAMSECIHICSVHRVAGPRKCGDSRWNSVAIMYKTWDKRFYMHFRLMSAIFKLLLSPTSDSMYTRSAVSEIVGVNLEYRICIPRGTCFRFYIRHFDLRLSTGRTLLGARVVISSSDFAASSKRNEATFSPTGYLRLLIQWQMQVSQSQFDKKTLTYHLHFRWRHSKTG